MKKFIETIKNIWKIEDLRSRILYTLGIILIYRLGTHIVLPGIDPVIISSLANSRQAGSGILDLLNLFTGGAFARASIFGLGIMPYISASIVVQLLGIAVPYFQKLQREGESGRRKINQITRYLTVAILIRNGISLIIMIGIIARMPQSLGIEFLSRLEQQGGGLVAFLVEILILFVVFMASILLVQGTRRIPVQYAKRIVGNKQYGGVRQYIPLKVNAAGVMPIIFAQAFMFIPITVAGFAKADAASGFAAVFSNPVGFWYNFTNAMLIILFTYFYTAITVNPTQMAEDMKKNGGFIPGVKPGRKTAEFLDSVMSRITLPGSFFLAMVAIMPAFAMLAGVNQSFAQFFGGTSLLIMVGVILDTLQQIESHLLMRHYDGLTKSGRIKGRAGSAAAI
jgi:preprotein translocase subunit SecY